MADPEEAGQAFSLLFCGVRLGRGSSRMARQRRASAGLPATILRPGPWPVSGCVRRASGDAVGGRFLHRYALRSAKCAGTRVLGG